MERLTPVVRACSLCDEVRPLFMHGDEPELCWVCSALWGHGYQCVSGAQIGARLPCECGYTGDDFKEIALAGGCPLTPVEPCGLPTPPTPEASDE